ncbi:MAG TPA: SDR family oxidoreductase [Pirellulales bacterium]|jgi:3-oxoacyl-[acyl-carrier protein] reductase|nr:SDR family oxidoreductase [Pirellulales bacterium]
MTDDQARDLRGKIAVVTGSSSGIGRATALELARAGAMVIVHARQSAEDAAFVADEIRASGSEAEVIMADLSDADARETFVAKAWRWRGGIDIWVNNAGADVLTGDAARWSVEQKLETLWRVDVGATLACSRLVGVRMKQRGHGVIVNTGWDQAEQGMAGESGEIFAATKGAIHAFTRSLAQSLAPEVRVNCVAPGWIRTSWGEHASQAWQDRARRESLLARWGAVEDVARATHFLVSPAAEFINGQVLMVNGGLRRYLP